MNPHSKPTPEQLQTATAELQRLLKQAGSVSALAESLSVTNASVYSWIRRGYTSATAAREAAKKFAVKKELLRPDVTIWY